MVLLSRTGTTLKSYLHNHGPCGEPFNNRKQEGGGIVALQMHERSSQLMRWRRSTLVLVSPLLLWFNHTLTSL